MNINNTKFHTFYSEQCLPISNTFSKLFWNNPPRPNSDSTDCICHVPRSVYSEPYSGLQLQSTWHSFHQCSHSDNTLASAVSIQWTFMELQTSRHPTCWRLETIGTLCVIRCLWNLHTRPLQSQLKSVHIHLYTEFAPDILLFTWQTLDLLPQDLCHVLLDHNWEAADERLKEREGWRR